jgi:hypothetical protein
MRHPDLVGPVELPSRRRVLRSGVVGVAIAALGFGAAAAQSATPVGTSGAGPTLLQGFSHGTLFRTQGSGPNLPPYTLILWGAVGGVASIDQPRGDVALLPAGRVVNALGAADPAPTVILTASSSAEGDPTGAGQLAWALTLTYAGLGSDPDAVTYQGALLDAGEATQRFGLTASEPPSSINIGPGYLIANAASLSLPARGGIRLRLP